MENNPPTPNNPTPEPAPAPEPTPAPAPEATSEVTHEAAPEAAPAPAPAPAEPTPTPEPASEPTPAPAPEPAPVPEPTPAPEPAPAAPIPVPTPESTPTPEPTPAEPTPAPTPEPTPKKKSKLPIIIGASVAAALLIGGAAAFAIYRSQPEVAALDAISGFLSANNVASSGSVNISNITDADGSDFGIKTAVINFDSQTTSSGNLTEATATVTLSDDSTVSLNFGEAFMNDGKLYLKVDGIKDAINALPQEYASTVGEYFGDIVDRIDGTWWEVSLSDILNASKDTIPEQTAQQIQAVYDCGVQTMNEINSSNELADLYKDHRFIKVANYSGSDIQASSGGTLYTISLDNNELAGFTKGIGDTNIANNFVTCYNNIEGVSPEIKASDAFKDVDADDFKDISDNLPELVLEVNFLTHNLDGFHVYYAGDSKATFSPSVRADLAFKYGSASVNVPDGAKSVLDLTDLVEAAGGNSSYFLMLVPGVNFVMTPLMMTQQANADKAASLANPSATDNTNTDNYYDDSEFTDGEAEAWDAS